MVYGADSVERVDRDLPSERETGNTYEKSFEIRFDEVDVIGHLHNTRYLE
jgi:acyl-CoA thioester hydrolase